MSAAAKPLTVEELARLLGDLVYRNEHEKQFEVGVVEGASIDDLLEEGAAAISRHFGAVP